MKTSTKTLLVSALTIACAGGAYAQGAGGSAGAGGAGGAGAGVRGGTGVAPSGNTLEQPSVQPGMNGDTSTYDQQHRSMRSRHNKGGYGSPGATGTNSGRSTVSPEMNQREPSDTTGYPPKEEGQTYNSDHEHH